MEQVLAGVDFHDALARAGDGCAAIGPDGRVIAWNAAMERLLGHPARDVIGRACCDVFGGYDEHGNRLCYPNCHVMSLAKRKEPIQSFELRARTKAGRAVWLSVSVLVAPANGAGPVTVHLMRDVTASKELLSLVHERITDARTNGDTAPADELTRRELEILRLLTQGMNTSAVATHLHVSQATVRNHVQNLFAKLGVHSRLEAVAYATRHRLF